MPAFTTNLELGSTAFVVIDSLNPRIEKLTVGMVTVSRTHPHYSMNEPCYHEEYMCVETGIRSGRIWTYGKNIFKTEEDAQRGVQMAKQKAWKQRVQAERRIAEIEERERKRDLAMLKNLQEKYGTCQEAKECTS